MLKHDHRFHGYNALRFVYKNGTAIHGHYFTIKSLKNPRRTSSRVAIVVSKKVLKSAVGRNRIRRRLYELFREEIGNLQEGFDIVCIVTSADPRSMETDILRKSLQDALGQSGLYKNT